MSYVFISYAQVDSDFANLLKIQIEKTGFHAWMDKDRVRPGADWSEEIDTGIREALAMVIVMSPEAKASEYVTYEWSFAVGARIPVIPIMYKEVALHPRLSRYQYVNFTNPSVRPWNYILDEINKQNTLDKKEAERLNRCKDDLVHYLWGSKVDITFLPHSFIDGVANEFNDKNVILELVDAANTFMGDPDRKHVIRRSVLEMNGTSYSAWQSIFDEARMKGPRTLAAILMILPIEKHNEQLHEERNDRINSLINYMDRS